MMAGVTWMRWQLCRGLGGNLPVDWVAGFVWIGWQPSRGLGGRNPWNMHHRRGIHVEYGCRLSSWPCPMACLSAEMTKA